MKIRRTLTALALCLAIAAGASAQQEPAPSRDSAQPLDSFGDIMDSDWLARLDNFAIMLQQSPDSTGHIVVTSVRSKYPGWPLRRANWAFGYLREARGLDPARLSVVSAGLGDAVKYELWIVPPGASLPIKPFDLSMLMAGEKNPLPFDRFSISQPWDIESVVDYDSYLDEKGRYAPLLEILRGDPSLRAHVIVYAARRERRGADRKLAARVKRSITTAHTIDVARLVAVGGGRRPHRTVELWLVPLGGPAPKPSPEPRPARR